ncbi:sucrose phosphate synthase [Selaginella moellendorffii]|uniref:Sucrose-phosphate synthase n=1 Tax=Selaginella moellendorffii TaxID=88036 RepID=D8REA5_SELML|nr:sucrose phosphate synthase [Selaginella moellendorffii]
MAGNEWINGYLEAILDTGTAGTIDYQQQRLLESSPARRIVAVNATKYFIQEVVSGFDETDIHQTWMKATVCRNSKERSARLENLCWRIWHISRKRKQIEWANTQRVADRHFEHEQGRKDAADDLCEDHPEADLHSDIAGTRLSRNSSETDVRKSFNEGQHKDKCLYIVLISLHGLVRGENMELGRDSDTGGQVKYVVEFARALAMMPEVYRVDLLTRQILAPDVDRSYGEPTETLAPGSYDCCGDEVGESSGAYIVRIPCGPRDQYLRKELLWPYIQEFVDGSLTHIVNMAKALGEQITGGDSVWPYVIHGHYADAGDIAALISGALNVPMVLTGHSLGRNKLEQLLKQGRQSKTDINTNYKIMRRIEAEEFSLDTAELVITSTRQEIEEQWGLYDGFDLKLEKVLRARIKRGVSCHGRHMPRMAVIAPGMDFRSVDQEAFDILEGEIEGEGIPVAPPSPKPEPPIWSEVMKFFTNPHKPMILALARPDPKKNLATLVKAFGESKPLRELANMTLIMGNRDDIDTMPGTSSNILTIVLKLIDKYDLYGQVAYPKHHKQNEVPDIYRLAAKTKGVFINPALVEPFGLTLIEAAAHGLPMVATMNGGPVDIQKTLSNGVLVDPHDEQAIATALIKLVADRLLWGECRRNGLKNIHMYSWPEHCKTYLSKISLCKRKQPLWQNNFSNHSTEDNSQEDSLKDVEDISLQLSDDGEVPENVEKGKQIYDKQLSIVATEQKLIGLEKLQNCKFPFLRRRKKVCVLAIDSYDSNKASKNMLAAVREIFTACKMGLTGFILSTAMTASETLSALAEDGIPVTDFDALVCNSGASLYYPSMSFNSQVHLVPDYDYDHHIDYHWNSDGIRKAMSRLTFSEAGDLPIIIEEELRSSTHCVAYRVNTANMVKVDEYRRLLRMRGLRCHIIYCLNTTKLHIVPLLASRSQAIRYLFVRWGMDIGNTVVFVGETGDSDYEQLLSGIHKIIVLTGLVPHRAAGKEDVVHTTGTREDVVPSESNNNLVATSCEAIAAALSKVSFQV